MTGITMDGRLYHVRVVYNTMERHFSLQSGINECYMLSGRHSRDLRGTGYSYQMGIEPDPLHPEDYDDFYQAVRGIRRWHGLKISFVPITPQRRPE